MMITNPSTFSSQFPSWIRTNIENTYLIRRDKGKDKTWINHLRQIQIISKIRLLFMEGNRKITNKV